MIRGLASLFGLVMLGAAGSLLVVFARAGLPSPFTVLCFGGFVLSAILLLVGGLVDSVTLGGRTIPWNVLVGSGEVVLAAAVVPLVIRSAAVSGDADSWFNAILTVVGSTFTAWFGVQIARDSPHVDLEMFQEMPLGPGIALAAALVGWTGVGLLVVVILGPLP